MGIQKDAGKILAFIYSNYVNKNSSVNPKMLIEITKWDGNRIDRAIKYLNDLGAVDIILTIGNYKGVQDFIMKRLTPLGIQMVENQKEFKKNFGFTINLGLIKIDWGFSES